MNKDEIIKALFKRNDTLCKDALDLITEQEKEIKRLKAENEYLDRTDEERYEEAEAKLKELQEGEEMKANGIDIYKDKRFNPYIAQDDFDCGYHEYAKEQHKKRVAENPDRIAFAIKQFENNNIEYTLKNEATGHFHCRRKSDDKLFQFYAGTGKIVGVSNKRGIHEFIRILTD